jgi:hypothetical protein
MGIHKTNTPSKQGVSFDQAPYFVQLGDLHHREPIKRSNCFLSIRQVTKNKLGDNKRVSGDVVPLQLLVECGVSLAKVIDPYRRICKNHFTFDLRRGMEAMAGDAPPRAANLRAASRSISALSASRMRALFSTKPVYSCAVLMRSSSKAMVVRKSFLLHQG